MRKPYMHGREPSTHIETPDLCWSEAAVRQRPELASKLPKNPSSPYYLTVFPEELFDLLPDHRPEVEAIEATLQEFVRHRNRQFQTEPCFPNATYRRWDSRGCFRGLRQHDSSDEVQARWFDLLTRTEKRIDLNTLFAYTPDYPNLDLGSTPHHTNRNQPGIKIRHWRIDLLGLDREETIEWIDKSQSIYPRIIAYSTGPFTDYGAIAMM